MRKTDRREKAGRPEVAPSARKWLAMVWLAVGVMAGVLGQRLAGSSPAFSPSAPPLSAAKPSKVPAPWGELEYTKLTLERPTEFISAYALIPKPRRWQFTPGTAQEIGRLFDGIGLTEAQRTELLSAAVLKSEGDATFLEPSDAFVLGLSEAVRERLYRVVGQQDGNELYRTPFLYPGSSFDEWFADAGCAPEHVNTVKRLCYRRGGALCFSDIEFILQIPSVAEKRRLMQILSRLPTVIMSLRVRPDSDIDGLVKYWAHAGRAKDLRSLLSGLARNGEGGVIDVSHMLPDFARTRLNSFPFPSQHPDVIRQDCFWTALNFFNENPDARFLEPEYRMKRLRSEYAEWEGQPGFGDIIGVIDGEGMMVHACVYVADGMVFTKNGYDAFAPWVLMDLGQVQALYSTVGRIRLIVLKQRGMS